MAGPDDEPGDVIEGGTVTHARAQDEVLADLARLHQLFQDEQVGFEDFESSKAALIAELDVG